VTPANQVDLGPVRYFLRIPPGHQREAVAITADNAAQLKNALVREDINVDACGRGSPLPEQIHDAAVEKVLSACYS
jgi:hypothetical protein